MLAVASTNSRGQVQLTYQISDRNSSASESRCKTSSQLRQTEIVCAGSCNSCSLFHTCLSCSHSASVFSLLQHCSCQYSVCGVSLSLSLITPAVVNKFTVVVLQFDDDALVSIPGLTQRISLIDPHTAIYGLSASPLTFGLCLLALLHTRSQAVPHCLCLSASLSQVADSNGRRKRIAFGVTALGEYTLYLHC